MIQRDALKEYAGGSLWVWPAGWVLVALVAGTTLSWIWRPSPEDPAPEPETFVKLVDAAVRIGFERTAVSLALLRLLENCAAVIHDNPKRTAAIDEQAALDDAEREIAQPAEALAVRTATHDLRAGLVESR